MTERSRSADDYDWFLGRAEALLRPVASLMRAGRSMIPIEGPASDHGREADELESVARPMLLAALWLAADRRGGGSSLETDDLSGGGQGRTVDVAAWLRDAVALGTDPASPGYWGGVSNYHQHAVEMAIITMALTIARDDLWEPLPRGVKGAALDWLGRIRGHAGYRNNHLFFDVLVLEFLAQQGAARAGDDDAIDRLFMHLESMHLGGGWFIDGGNESFDHYNAYAFHTYGLFWAERYGDRDGARAERWRSWAGAFVRDYAHCFAATGEPVPIGRSLTYRFNGVGVFPLALSNGIDTVGPGLAREICRRSIDFFTSRPIGQSQGCLSIGWTDRFDGIREPYSCAGSPYWAAKGLMMLQLPRDHAFFTADAEPLPAEQRFTRVLATPGWTLRGVDGGEVELINSGGVCSPGAIGRFGAHRWGRLAYRTGVGNLVPTRADEPPADGQLVAFAARDRRRFGRVGAIPVGRSAGAAGCHFALGSKESGLHVPVESRAEWFGDWLLWQFLVRPVEPVTLTFGGFALGGEGLIESEWTDIEARARCGGRTSIVQAVLGGGEHGVLRHAPGEPRQHTRGSRHAAPVVVWANLAGDTCLAVLMCVTSDNAIAEPWRVVQPNNVRLVLEHPTLGRWTPSRALEVGI